MNVYFVLRRLPWVHEVILVDAGSGDSTVQAARLALPGITVVEPARPGRGAAVAAGLAAVTGDVVVLFDADGTADPAQIPAFVEALVSGADVVRGSRFLPGGRPADSSPLRRVRDRALNRAGSLLFGTGVGDLFHGHVAFWTDLIGLLELPDTGGSLGRHWGDGEEIDAVLSHRFAGLRTRELPSVEQLRLFGEPASPGPREALGAVRALLTERRRARRAARDALRLQTLLDAPAATEDRLSASA